MRHAAAALLVLLAQPAFAADGFFRHLESAPHESAAAGPRASSVLCTLVVRYDIATPSAQEITYQGPQAQCIGGYLQAVKAATLPKVAGGIDPFTAGPPHDCAIVVVFDSLAPTSPSTSFGGPSSCGVTWATALPAARQNVGCAYGQGQCAS